AGAADQVAMLKRPRNGPDATLHVSGRDVREQEIHLRWEDSTTRFQRTDVPPINVRSQERKEILAALRQFAVPATAEQVAEKMGTPERTDAIKRNLSRMFRNCEINRPSRGKYCLSA